MRRAGNMVGNALLNLIPILGPAASIWFKSNSRNNRLLQQHLAGEPPGPASPQTKILFAAVLVFVALLFVASLMVWVAAYRFFSELLAGLRALVRDGLPKTYPLVGRRKRALAAWGTADPRAAWKSIFQ